VPNRRTVLEYGPAPCFADIRGTGPLGGAYNATDAARLAPWTSFKYPCTLALLTRRLQIQSPELFYPRVNKRAITGVERSDHAPTARMDSKVRTGTDAPDPLE